MNITEIKTKLGMPSLSMVRQLDQTTQAPQPWLSHWDNDKRVRVTMHDDTFQKVKANPALTGLAVKVEEVAATPERAAYTRAIVIEPKNIEAEF